MYTREHRTIGVLGVMITRTCELKGIAAHDSHHMRVVVTFTSCPLNMHSERGKVTTVMVLMSVIVGS